MQHDLRSWHLTQSAVARSSEKVKTTERPGAATSTNDKYDEEGRTDRLTAFLVKLGKIRNCFLSYVVASYSFKGWNVMYQHVETSVTDCIYVIST